jgi:hypothetical protein
LSREDNNTSFSARLGYGFIKRGSASIFYTYNNNNSTARGFGFASTTIGLELGYRL